MKVEANINSDRNYIINSRRSIVYILTYLKANQKPLLTIFSMSINTGPSDEEQGDGHCV